MDAKKSIDAQQKIELIQKALAADKHRDWGLLVYLGKMELLLLGMEHRHEGGYNYKDEDLLAMWNKWNELDKAARDRNKLVELINGVAFDGPDHIAEAKKLPDLELLTINTGRLHRRLRASVAFGWPGLFF